MGDAENSHSGQYLLMKKNVCMLRFSLHSTSLRTRGRVVGQIPVSYTHLEFGGIAYNNDDNGWGYGHKVDTEQEFLRRFDAITSAIKKLPYCCGFCYTQVTDVQQEINGLMDIDRNFKVNPEAVREINLRQIEK